MSDSTPFFYRFGPDFTSQGVVFRLWAPEARQVDLKLSDQFHRMTRDADGWYLSPPLASPVGTPYSFLINDDLLVPDPASRRQSRDVHGPSVVYRPGPMPPPLALPGHNHRWWETVLYEVHTGTFTGDGTFAAVIPQLPRLTELGVTALELLPVADFPGRRNWGYDGVLPFAPDRAYGSPGDLLKLIGAAHAADLAVWLDVVYNHFGPEGNYLHLYAPQFFSDRIETPWGPGIDFSRPEVRRFFVENGVYWIREFGIDGLRLDAVHAIHDPAAAGGGVHILNEIAATIRRYSPKGKEVHLVLENDKNQASFLSPDLYNAQWNDDIHHAFHVLLTGEDFGYYGDYAKNPEQKLARALAEGFVYQGELSPGTGLPRGEPSSHLSPTRFISFLQNHDQIGNRAQGERLAALTSADALHAAVALHLLAPQIPLIFMGEETGTTRPFLFFCDFGEELAEAVRAGRRREFGLDGIPDPVDGDTARRCVLPEGIKNKWFQRYRHLLDLRRTELVPVLSRLRPGVVTGGTTGGKTRGSTVPRVTWDAPDSRWSIAFNLTSERRRRGKLPNIDPLYVATPDGRRERNVFPPWTTMVWKEPL